MSAMEQARQAIRAALRDEGFMDGDGILCEIVEADVQRVADAMLAALVEQMALAEQAEPRWSNPDGGGVSHPLPPKHFRLVTDWREDS